MKILFAILICITLCGCATVPSWYDRGTKLGVTKEQVFPKTGRPLNWTRQIINGKTYESWSFWGDGATYDFVDNILVGHSFRGCYYSKDNTEDVRNYLPK